ncbi:MAG: hypothetical protein RL235_229 [Chlamydiota bacterium]
MPVDFFDLSSFDHSDLWEPKGTPWSALEALSSYFTRCHLGAFASVISSGVHLVRPELIAIGPDVTIEPGAWIEGPCVIGAGCVIRHGAYLRGEVMLGRGCVVGHGTEIKHSILLNKAHAPHFCYVGDSIIGANVNLGAGVKCANVRLDRKMVSVMFAGRKMATRLKKLGAIIGDGAQIGCNCVLNPGTLIGPGAWVHPLLNVHGTIPARHRVQGTQSWTVEPIAEQILGALLQ